MKEPAKHNLPELRFPEFDGEWNHKTVQSLGLEISDGNYGELYPRSDHFVPQGVAFIRANNLKGGRVVWPDMRFLTPKHHATLRSGHLQTSDVLVTTRGEIGSVALVGKEFSGANINAQICLLRNSSDCTQEFLFHSLVRPKAKKQFIELTTGSALKQLPRRNLSRVVISIPTLPEQQKIASFLSAVDEKIAQLQEKKTLLEAYKKGCMQKLFSQTLRFKDDNGNDYPDWEEKKLGDVASINPKSSSLPNKFTYIDLESVNDGILTSPPIIEKNSAPSRAQRVLSKNDILFQLVRPYQQNNLFFKFEGNYVASTGYAQIRANSVPKFLFHLLLTMPFVNKVLERCTGTSYPAINSKDLEKIIIVLPKTEKEQQKIANFLSAIDDKITLATTQLEQTKTFKKGLLQKMFV